MASADAQYVIEVASTVNGVDATAAELDSLSAKLSGSGINAAMFEDAITKLSSDLDKARAASQAANAALAEGRTKYAQLEVAASKAAKAVEKMEQAADGMADAQKAVDAARGEVDAAVARGAGSAEIKKLNANLRKAERNLAKAKAAADGLGDARAEADQAAKAAADYAGELDRLEREAEQAAAAQGELEDSLGNVRKMQKRVNDQLGDAATNLSTFRGALGDIGGPIAEFGERLLFPAQAFVDLREKFGTGTAAMTVAGFGLVRVLTALVTALAAVGAAAVAAVAALGAFAVKASNARRELELTREAAARLTPALRGIPWDDIASDTLVAESRLRELTKSLRAAGVEASDLPAALRAAATAERALGAGGADRFVEQLRDGTASVKEMADAINRDLGDIAARRLLGLESQSLRFKRNLGGLFDGFNIEPALKGLASLVALFDESTATGRAMKAALGAVLDPIIENAREAAWAVEAFALGFAIGLTKIYSKAKPTIDRISELLGLDGADWQLEEVLDAVAAAGQRLAPVFVAAALVFGALATAVGVVVAAVLGVYAVFSELNQLIGRGIVIVAQFAAELVNSVVGAASDSISALSGVLGEFTSMGGSMIDGLVQGITAGTSRLISAITGAVGGAVDAAKGALGIASPSKVFAEMGDQTGEGYVRGVKQQRDAAHTAVRELTDAEAAAPQRSDAGASPSVTNTSTTSRDDSRTIVIQSLTVDASSAPAGFVEWIESLALRGTA
jgi:predicted  nucleic acid-binding Zn-ribbon protein